MEKIETDLEATESKQRTLLKGYESVHSQASSLIVFSVLWKDLEDHFNSTRVSIETRFRDLLIREGEVGAREKQLDAKASDFHSEMESKAGDLRGLENLKEQKLKEVIDSKNHLHSLMSLIKEHSDEVIVQEERLMEVENFVREKEGELDSVERRIKERTKKLNWVDKIVEEKSKLAECKEKEVRGFQEVLDKYVKDIEVKQRELNEIVGSVEARRKEEIKGIKRSIKECEKELELKEEKLRLVGKSLVECLNKLESKEKMVREMDLKERDFCLLKNSMKEWSCKLEFKERELELKEKQVESNIGELKLMDKRVNELKEKHLELQKSRQEGEKHLDTLSRGLQTKEMQLKDRANELELQQKELDSIKKSTEEHNQSLKSKERQLEKQGKELELMKQELDSIKKSTEVHNQSLKSREGQLEDQTKELELKKKEVDSVKKSTEEHNRSLNLKEKQLEDQAKDLELKQKEFDLIKNSTEEHIQNLKSKERQLEDQAKQLKLRQKSFESIKKSTAAHTQNLKSKERQLEDQAKELELKKKEFDSIKKSTEEHTQNLTSKERQLDDQAKELQLKQKEFDLIKKSIEEHTQNLKSKERQLEDQAKELQRKQKECDLIKKSTEEHTPNLKSKQNASVLHSKVKIEQLEHMPANNAIVSSSASHQSSRIKDGRGLQLFMNEHLKRSDLVGSEILAVLQGSSDPAKLVLTAMQGFYPSNLAVDNRECDFDLRVVRRSCVLLLEELKRFEPQINPQVKAEAIKLAGEWKAKMTTATENWLEVLGFLRLVTSYDITSDFDVKELQRLLAIVAMHEQATELSQALGTTEEASASICYSPVKTATPESSLAKSPATVSSPNHSLTATKDARNLQAFLNQLLSGNHLMKDNTSAALQRSSDPEKFVLDVMQNSFSQYWRNGDTGSKETIMLNYINLLEQLMGVLPHVGPHVKEDATQLAVQWKAKMGVDTEKPLELLGFLQFITTYGLLSTLATDDIVMILGRISQKKQSRELCQTLSFAEKIPAHFIRNLIEKKQLIDAVRVICTFKLIDTFPPEPLLEKFVQNARSWHKKICIKKKSLDEKEKVIADEISDLRAVIQCIKDCNLESKYSSRSIEILIDSLEKRKENWRRSATSLGSNGGKAEQQEEKKSLNCKGAEEPKKSVQQQEQRIPIAPKVEQEEQRIPVAPKVVQEEQRIPIASNVVQQEQRIPIASNVVQQEQRIPIASKVVQHNQKKGKKRRNPRQQQQQYQNKFQRTSEPAARPYPMPTCPPDYPRRSFSPWPQENYRCPGQQFGMADDFGMGANCGHPGQFGMPANDYQTGGMHHSYSFMRSPPSYGSY